MIVPGSPVLRAKGRRSSTGNAEEEDTGRGSILGVLGVRIWQGSGKQLGVRPGPVERILLQRGNKELGRQAVEGLARRLAPESGGHPGSRKTEGVDELGWAVEGPRKPAEWKAEKSGGNAKLHAGGGRQGQSSRWR